MDSGDLDRDGDLDIAANGYWIENPGGDLTGLYNGRVAGVNGDGKLDLAGPTGHEGDPYVIYLAN